MVAKFKKKKGQSLLEFALMVPAIVLMLHILLQTENAISTAIVNLRYARAQLHYLMFNHNTYLEPDSFHKLNNGAFMRRFWVMVDNKTRFGTENADSIQPEAPIRAIGINERDFISLASDEAQQEYPEIQYRYKVRIRSVAFTCLPPLGFDSAFRFTERGLGEYTFKVGQGSFKACTPEY
jgi:hypothetical protein